MVEGGWRRETLSSVIVSPNSSFPDGVQCLRASYKSVYTFCNSPSYQQADNADKKHIASCQQTCCKLIVKTFYPKACCKLFQQVVTSLQTTSCNN